MPTNVDPFNHQWVTGDLAAMAARVEAGEPAATLRQQLFETLWPWATQMADREVRRLPARADGDETRSQLLGAVWQATQRIDWSNYRGWPSLLRRRLLGARMDAARTDDPLSRRHRQAFTRCLTAIAAEEQARGRRLAATERDAVAATIFPSSASRPGLLAELAELASSHEAAGDASVEAADDRWDPERVVLDAELRQAVQSWLSSLPGDVAAPLVAWCHQGSNRSLPRSVAQLAAPFYPALVEAVRVPA